MFCVLSKIRNRYVISAIFLVHLYSQLFFEHCFTFVLSALLQGAICAGLWKMNLRSHKTTKVGLKIEHFPNHIRIPISYNTSIDLIVCTSFSFVWPDPNLNYSWHCLRPLQFQPLSDVASFKWVVGKRTLWWCGKPWSGVALESSENPFGPDIRDRSHRDSSHLRDICQG